MIVANTKVIFTIYFLYTIFDLILKQLKENVNSS